MNFDFQHYIDLQRKIKEINRYISFHREDLNIFSSSVENLYIDSCSFFNSLCLSIYKEESIIENPFLDKFVTEEFNSNNVIEEDLSLKIYIDLLEEVFTISDKQLILNFYEEYYFKAYLVEDYNKPQERYFPKRKNVFKIRPFNNWSQNKFLTWHKDFMKLKQEGEVNNKATLVNIFNVMAANYILLTLKYNEDFIGGTVADEIYDVFTPMYKHLDNRKKVLV